MQRVQILQRTLVFGEGVQPPQSQRDSGQGPTTGQRVGGKSEAGKRTTNTFLGGSHGEPGTRPGVLAGFGGSRQS